MAENIITPQVTVLLPVYNAEKYVKEAIDSILSQTFTDFEILVIDDGSTDGSLPIIRSFTDTRVRVVENPKNLGLIETLNKGIKLSKGKYIARMDADDISFPDRLQSQVKYLDTHTDVIVIGGGIELLGGERDGVTRLMPAEHEEIKVGLLFGSKLYHPTVMMRRAVLVENALFYHRDYPHAEDYEYWVRLSRYGELHNLDKALIKYRIHSTSIGATKGDERLPTIDSIRRQQLDQLLDLSVEEFELFSAVARYKFPKGLGDLKSVEDIFGMIIGANKVKMIYQQPILQVALQNILINAVKYSGLRRRQKLKFIFLSKFVPIPDKVNYILSILGGAI